MRIFMPLLYPVRNAHEELTYRDDCINTSAWVSRCSFNYFGQCEKPQSVGRATGTDLHAFFCIVSGSLSSFPQS